MSRSVGGTWELHTYSPSPSCGDITPWELLQDYLPGWKRSDGDGDGGPSIVRVSPWLAYRSHSKINENPNLVSANFLSGKVY